MSSNYQRVYISSSAYESARITAGIESNVVAGARSSSLVADRKEDARITVQAVSLSNYSVESGLSHVVADYPVYAQVSRSQASSDSRTLSSTVSGRSEYSIVQESVGGEAEAPSAVVTVEAASGASHLLSALTPVVAVRSTVEKVNVWYGEAGSAAKTEESSASDSASLTAVLVPAQAYEHGLTGLREILIEHAVPVLYPVAAEEPPVPVPGEAPRTEATGEVTLTLSDLLDEPRLLETFLEKAPGVLRETLVAMGFKDAPKDLKALLDYYWSKYNTYCAGNKSSSSECTQLEFVKGMFSATTFIYEYKDHLYKAKQLLADAQKGDLQSISRNPIFRALVKVYEILPAIGDADLRNAFLGSLGLSSPEELQQLLQKIARGQQLSDNEITTLALVSRLYDEKWRDFRNYATLALNVEDEIKGIDPSLYNMYQGLLAFMKQRGLNIHRVDIDTLPREVVDAYYVAVLRALQNRGAPEYTKSYITEISSMEAVARVLGNINILGHFSSAVSNAIKSLLMWFGVDEKTAENMAMVGASYTVAVTLGTITLATGGAAAPVVLGLVGLSSLSTLAQIATLTDNPLERDALVNYFKENLPWILASIGVAVLGGYTGAKLGMYIEKNVTLPLLVKMYNKALDSGHYTLASKIRGFLENRLSQYTVVARLDAEDYSFRLYVDEDGKLIVQLASKGRWELVHTSKTLSNDFVALLQDQQSREVLGGIVRRVIPEIKGSKESVERFLSNLDKLASDVAMRTGDAAIARDVLTLIRDAFKDARVLDAMKTGRVLRVVPTNSGAVIETDVGAYVLVKAPGAVEPYVFFTNKNALGALQLYTTLRDTGVNINEFISVASKYSGAENWIGKVGDFEVVFNGGRLLISKGGSKLAEVVIAGKVIENLPAAAQIVESLQKAGVPYTIIKAMAQGYASGGLTPGVVPVDVAIPVANLYQTIAEAIRGQGVIGERTVAVTTSKGVVTVNYAWYVGEDGAKAFEGAIKVLSTESMKDAAKAIVQNKLGAELGKGGVLYSYVLSLPADKAEQLSSILKEALDQVYLLVKSGKIAEASQVASKTLTSVEALAGKGAAQTVGQMMLQAMMLSSEGRQIFFTVPATVSSSSNIYIPVVLAATEASTTMTEQAAKANATASSTMLSEIAKTMSSRGLLSLSVSKSINEYESIVAQRQAEQVFTRTTINVRMQGVGEPRSITPSLKLIEEHTSERVPARAEVVLPSYQFRNIPQGVGEPRNIVPSLRLIEEHTWESIPVREARVLPSYVPRLEVVPIEELSKVALQLAPRTLYQTEAVEVSQLVTTTYMKPVLSLESITRDITVIPVIVGYVIDIPTPSIPVFDIPRGPQKDKEPPPPQLGSSGLLPLPRLDFAPGSAVPGEERYKHVLEE
ncbi:MAG: hypothetical protein QW230_03095, partial [Thermofilum sp.]